MPSQPPTVLASQNGAALAIVHVDGSGKVDTWDIPINATVTIQPAAGFGSVTQTGTGVSKATAEANIDTTLTADGAL